MRYDIDLIQQLCREVGLPSTSHADERVDIELRPGIVLRFQNAERDEDCLVEFPGTPWHTHDEFMFADGRGYYVELDYLDVLTGLTDGRVLICELRKNGQIMDRSLIHRDYNDEFKYMEEDEEIVVFRAARTDRGTLGERA